jgi:hypothetical protein
LEIEDDRQPGVVRRHARNDASPGAMATSEETTDFCRFVPRGQCIRVVAGDIC